MGLPKQYKTVNVSPETHSIIKEYLDNKRNGEDIGKFFDSSAIEKMNREINDLGTIKLKRNFYDTTKYGREKSI